MRTILYLTNTTRLDGLIVGLYGENNRYATVHAALGAGSPVVQWASGDRQIVTAKDTWENSDWLAAYLGALSGSLHVVRHTNAPSNEEWAQVVAVLDSMRSKLALSYGNQGRHEADRNILESKLYCYLADAVVAKLEPVNATFTKAHFDGLWEELEALFPIEDLLADQLDYLHGLLSGKRITAGSALKKVIPDADLANLVSALPSGAVAKESYKSFETIRDRILALGTQAAKL